MTGPSAAYLHGSSALDPLPVHITVPYETRKASRPGIVVHNSTFLDHDREERLGLPVLGLERVLADLACTIEPWAALAVLDEALARVADLDRARLRRSIRELIGVRPDPRGTVSEPD